MRISWSIGIAALALLGASACSTLLATEATAPIGATPQSYRQAVDALVAATRTKDEFQSTAMIERAPCAFGFYVSPGRQSSLGFLFDARHLDLDAITAAQGQVASSAVSRRIACAKQHGDCASNTGMPVPYVEVAAPTAEDMERALSALRQIQAYCRTQPPVP